MLGKRLVINSLFILFASPLANAFLPNHGGLVHLAQGKRLMMTRLKEAAVDMTMAAYDKAMSSAVVNTNSSPLEGAPTVPSSSVPKSTGKIESLESLDDYLNYIDSAPKDSLVVVKYYGNFCPLCKRVAMKYKKMARFYSTAPIQFAQIEKSVHPDLFTTVEVTTFPYLQIFRNGQCIASHGTESASRFESIVNDTIQNFLRMEDSHWNSFLRAFEGPIQKATNNLRRMWGYL